MIKVSVVGATGYTGIELIKILRCHPRVELACLTTRQAKPIPVRQLAPELPPGFDAVIRKSGLGEVARKSDVVFLCLPHMEAAAAGRTFFRAGKIVIDLSADFRLKRAADYVRWYGGRPGAPELLAKAVYGLPEIYREKIESADLIANPGCYPTAALLALYPLVKSRLVDPADVIIDAKSGVSGAGKKLTASAQFCEVDENFFAYKVGKHQHTPEIDQVLSDVNGKRMNVCLTTHLLPVNRGILATVYAKRKKNISAEKVYRAFERQYAPEPFVRLLPPGEYPSLKAVQNTNYCDLGIWSDPESQRVTVISAIDNLVKGASGQAVQNMNIRCGFREEEGVEA
ncbi:MAG: N-acetyl-gamma-glutamyl-phosphate reductase [Omnitrophica bacterium GWA2_52_8]|nr:MAG: N-acetyl-gamma-glutamyl-phosphate reductase [Omnitrophica bacterium GWA2_52_8]